MCIAVRQFADISFLHTTKNMNSLEHVQRRAARWASGSRWNPCSYSWSKSSDECITELKWPSIHQSHVYFSICQVHDILHYHNFVNHFQLSNAPTRSNPLSIQPIQSSINSYRYSFFINSPFLWNSIPYAILRIKQSGLFRLALRRYLFDFFLIVISCCVYVFIVFMFLYT